MLSTVLSVGADELGTVVRSAAITAALVLLTVLLSSWHRERPVPGSPIGPKRASSSKSIGSATSSASGAPGAADAAWRRKDGRFKHCALRQDPFSEDVGPPRYSLENLDDLPLPQMTEQEALGVRTLKERVEDLTSRGNVRTDSSTLIRFLRARKGNLKASEDYFRQSVAYREEVGLDRPVEETWNLQAYEQCLAPWVARGGIVGVAKKGGIIGWERMGTSQWPQLSETVSSEHIRKLDAMHMLRTLAAFEEDGQNRRMHWCESSVLVIDLGGADEKWMSLKVIRAYGKLVKCRDMLMPNTLAHIFLIQAPVWFSATYNIAKHVLDPSTRKKVVVTSSPEASLTELRKHMSDDVIPAYVGGSLHTDGDPDCQKFLGTACRDPIPQEAFDRFNHLLEHGNGAEIARRSNSLRAEDDASDRSCMFCMRSCNGKRS